MAKYKCLCGCGAVAEAKDDKVPTCCGKPMEKVGNETKEEKCGCSCC